MANSPTIDAILARLAAIDTGCTRVLGRVCGGPGETHPSSWCRACCARALTRHVAALTADPFRDARVDASVAYAAGAAAGREFGRGEGAPPSLVALHAAWCTSLDVLVTLNKEGEHQDVDALYEACDRHDAARDALLSWTPKETP